MKKKKIFLILIVLLLSCVEKKERIDLAGSWNLLTSFQDNFNGTIIDPENRMWMKCSYGQVWDQTTNTCTGTGGGTTFGAKSVSACAVEGGCFDTLNLELNSGPAFSACDDLVFAGFSDWRLPTKNEMSYLAKLFGNRKTFLVSFPNTPDDKFFWTKSISETDPKLAYAINFAETDFGKEFTRTTTTVLYVRCVRP
ncbi:MAG: DUF1566 domain-containing protein [Leptospiraceae bacterium]|nr:DUF1566 domain-containing protein [Leptospiraceae bacterium]MDW7976452.1 DUF1566 domain-containing protein [Leptospiraceae bacterium]